MTRIIRPIVYPRQSDPERVAVARAANALREGLDVFFALGLIDREDIPRIDVVIEPPSMRGSCGVAGMLVCPSDMVAGNRGEHAADLVMVVDPPAVGLLGPGDLLAVGVHVGLHLLRPETGTYRSANREPTTESYTSRGPTPAEVLRQLDPDLVEMIGDAQARELAARIASEVTVPDGVVVPPSASRPDVLHDEGWLLTERIACQTLGVLPKHALVANCPCRLIAEKAPLAEEAR